MPDDATRQGVEDQDVFDGMDLEPVTAESSKEEGQIETAPSKPVPPEKKEEPKPQGDESGAVPNADAKRKRIADKKAAISQEEWQTAQELIEAQAAELATTKMEREQAKFEATNPIVLSEENKEKWEELCKAKADPAHKYHKLDYSDLKHFLVTEEVAAENEEAMEEFEESQRKPLTPPNFGTGSVKPKLPGGVDPETHAWLKAKGYTDEQIADSGNISVTR